MTRRSRGIHAAWHFWHAASFGGESGLRKVSLCGIHPLTQRYESPRFQCYKIKRLGYGKRKKDRTTSSGFN
ncbi:DUF3265 domain-containing protein [Vibrio vulnificus]|nr:DUF3265 domain-containing protein [Vibrio vulnificus]ELI3524719.1 DUF3265 domain-containing protein [Vibrio vulnificus]